MIDIRILIDPKDYKRLVNAVNRVSQAVNLSTKILPHRMALDAAELLRRNIQRGAFAGSYPGYNPRYAAYKQIMFGSSKPWVLFGDVLSSITVFSYGKGYMAGIPAGRMDRGEKGWFGTGKPSYIAAYARANEFGEGPTPERPMFRPTFAQYKEWGMGPQIKGTFTRIKQRWR